MVVAYLARLPLALLLLVSCGREPQTGEAARPTIQNDTQYDATKAGGDRSYSDLQNRIAAEKEGRSAEPADIPGVLNHRWIVNGTFSGCPAASDWFAMQEVLQDSNPNNDLSVNLPPRCVYIRPGAIVIAPLKDQRQRVRHNGHAYERFELDDGRVLWTDGMDEVTTSHLGAAAR